MSLAALKAKTKQKEHISKGGFSLNGGRRNTSYVGKTRHIRTYTPITSYGGARTYGGSSDTADIIVNSSYKSNDATIIKPSVRSTKGRERRPRLDRVRPRPLQSRRGSITARIPVAAHIRRIQIGRASCRERV